MNKFALGLLAAAGLCLGMICQSASAADLAVRAPLPRPVIVPTWTGFYVGFNAGGGVANGHMLDQDCFECADTLFQTGFGTVGGQLGYNYQWNSVVLGIEADYNWLGAKKTNFFALDDCGFPAQGPCAQAAFKLNQFATIRGRAGLAVGPGLIYVTAGAVWGHFDSLINTLPANGTNQFFITDNEWRPGIAAGAGLEFMPWGPHWVVRAEYMYLNFTDNTSACQPTGGNTNFQVSCRNQFHINFGSTAQLARAGLSYKF
jgi:outer membrane immunogenic protein